MNQKDKLFNIVKSLSKNEKRYFQLYSNFFQKEVTNYSLLFDILVNMERYDEEEVLTKLPESFKKKGFPALKSTLKNHIFEALVLFSKKNTAAIQDYQGLAIAAMLVSRGLWSEAEIKLKSMEKIAEKKENFIQLVNIYYYLINVEVSKGGQPDLKAAKQIKIYREKIIDCQTKDLQLSKIRKINSDIELHSYELTKQLKSRKMNLNKILEEEFLSINEQELLSPKVKYEYWNSLAYNYHLLNRHKDYFAALQKQYEIARPHAYLKPPRKFAILLVNLLLACTNEKDSKKFLLFLAELETIIKLSSKKGRTFFLGWKYIRLYGFHNLYPNELNHLKWHEEAQLYYKKETQSFNIEFRTELIMGISTYEFIRKEYKNTLDIINQISHFESITSKNTHFIPLKIMALLCYLETNKTAQMQKEWLSLRRTIKRDDYSSKSMQQFIALFSKTLLFNSPNKMERYQKLSAFLKTNEMEFLLTNKLEFLQNWLVLQIKNS